MLPQIFQWQKALLLCADIYKSGVYIFFYLTNLPQIYITHRKKRTALLGTDFHEISILQQRYLRTTREGVYIYY